MADGADDARRGGETGGARARRRPRAERSRPAERRGAPQRVLRRRALVARLRASGNTFGRLVALLHAVERAVVREALRDPDDLFAQELQLPLDAVVADLAVLVDLE